MVLLLFFLSGAAALVYEVAWARSLGLVFGASHFAVATVLAVYMGGQALGSALFARRADRAVRPLRLYGLLELGIGLSAMAFLGMMKVYPQIYGSLARLGEENHVYLTALRTVFAVLAMMAPATLMGGTLPVLTRFAAGRGGGTVRELSRLYALNTFGAVAGSLAAGLVLLRSLGVTATLSLAAAISAAVGAAAIFLDQRAAPLDPVEPASPATASARDLAERLALLGIAISGFCALGYEVLWTRMLTLVLGTSTYSFTIILVAFLAGIGLGSHAFGWLRGGSATRTTLLFGGSQLAIGASALGVTILMRSLPAVTNRIQLATVGVTGAEFSGRLFASAAVACTYILVPAFFMGAAFPAAVSAFRGGRHDAGSVVGRVLSANTAGAILGSLASGFLLLRFFGIERSLQMLVVLNLAIGLALIASLAPARAVLAAVPALAVAALCVRAAFPDWGRVWDRKFFASYINSRREFDTPERARDFMENIEVLYYYEGIDETVSVIGARGDVQTYLVNGRPEASTYPGDMQVQRTLGHLPMLLHPRPRSAFILGTGSGMTLGAVAAHPELERLVLGEIEEGMLGVARTFERWNGRVLDDPRLHIVFNDGRNFLSTTREKFDVISADPIHPWSGGAGYLYTREYFRSVADRLAPGGIACQWLPMYELSVHDVKTVVRTFSESFPHVMIWLTWYDAVIVGSADPFVIDEAALARRLDVPPIREDLAAVHMGTAGDFLSFFLAGTGGAREFARGGDLNTDDNLALEFSAPASQGIAGLDGRNVAALSAVREGLLPYLVPSGSPDQPRRWSRSLEANQLFDRAHAAFLSPQRPPDLDRLLALLKTQSPDHAPLRFLLEERDFLARTEPALVAAAEFPVGGPGGKARTLRISGVRQFVGKERVLVSFVDNARREIYGQRYLDGSYEHLDGEASRYVASTLAALQAAARTVTPGPDGLPPETEVTAALRREAERLVGRRTTGPADGAAD